MKRGRGQRGLAAATVDLIDTCIKIIEPIQPITVRGVAYKLFVAKLIDSMSQPNTQRVSRILTVAREQEWIPWEWIVDESRQIESQPAFRNLEDYAHAVELAYRRDFWADQEFRVILISEKSTVGGLLRPVLDQYGVPFFAAHGFNSATKVHELAEDIQKDNRFHIFLYVGDYDPSGMYMSEVDLKDRLIRYGASAFDVSRIALLLPDTWELPSFEASTKAKDPRYRWYVDHYGNEAWEVDAMDPADLRELVRSYVVDRIDKEAWERHQMIEAAQRETTKRVAAQMASMESRED
jgi:hypothetical protein